MDLAGITPSYRNDRHRPYVLVTAARNERDVIRPTLNSVVAQTITPQMWVIVSDNSVDGTDDVVRSFAAKHPFIRLCRNDEPTERNTAAKVNAINMGIKALAETDYAYIGNVDADISFGSELLRNANRTLRNGRGTRRHRRPDLSDGRPWRGGRGENEHGKRRWGHSVLP